jgi:hypothetical protein
MSPLTLEASSEERLHPHLARAPMLRVWIVDPGDQGSGDPEERQCSASS